MTKRFREEVDVANLKVASDQTELQICGVVGEISPMKKGRSASYFDGKMSDGKAKVRLFGFDDSIRKRLSDVSGSAVVLSNCQVKKARYSDDFEVLVTKSSIIEKSDRKFEIPDAADDTNKNEKTSLNQLSGMPPFTKVTCEVKILRVDDVTETVNGKKLQNVLVADSTGMAKVTLWENDVNRLKVLKSYRLTKMLVREFRGQVQLSATKEDTQMVEIDDLASVKEDDDLLLNSTLTNAKIVGVSSLEKYLSCLKCSGKVNTDGEYGSCNKCGMFQCLDACKEEATAQLMVRSSTGNLMFKAFGKVLQQIAGEEVTAITLLQAQPFTAFHQDGIINSISRSSTTGLNKVEK